MSELAEAVSRTIHDQNFLWWAVYRNWRFKIVVYTEKDYMYEPIETLDLSVRSFNCLKRAGIITIHDLVSAINGREDLKKFRNLGSKSADEIMLRLFLFQYARLEDNRKGKYLRRIQDINSIHS